MGIHHSSNTKTCHDHDNNCQKRHSTASLTNEQRGGRAQTEARGGSAGCRLRRFGAGLRARHRSGPARWCPPLGAHLRLASTNNKTQPRCLPAAACQPASAPGPASLTQCSHHLPWKYPGTFLSYYRPPNSTFWIIYCKSGFMDR